MSVLSFFSEYAAGGVQGRLDEIHLAPLGNVSLALHPTCRLLLAATLFSRLDEIHLAPLGNVSLALHPTCRHPPAATLLCRLDEIHLFRGT
ncbi:MAG: hypothetical protein MJY84_04045 [Bacteroidales bacterium]|nr:hypothetical protein [Bacteroidales bacterium]